MDQTRNVHARKNGWIDEDHSYIPSPMRRGIIKKNSWFSYDIKFYITQMYIKYEGQ